jgi:sulfite reductase (NADPH) flavoprotein alpha-component
MNAPTRIAHAPVPVIPPSAPFTPEQRAWLSGFLAAALSTDTGPAEAPWGFEATALAGLVPDAAGAHAQDGDDGAPWHDPSLPLPERMKLAEARPLHRRMMAAMAQQDCGQCGSSCESYANAIAARGEERLNLCAPGGKDTLRMLRSLVEELDGGATPREETVVADRALPSPIARDGVKQPGYCREAPIEAVFLGRRKLNGEGSEKATYHIDLDISDSGIDYAVGDSFGVFPRNDSGQVDQVLAALHAPADFPIGDKPIKQILEEEVSLGLAPDMLFALLSYVTGGERRAKARALAKGEDPDGDAATLDVLAAVEKLVGRPPDPEAFVEALDPLQPRLYSISSSHKAHPGRVSLTVDHVTYRVGERERLGVASTYLARALQTGDRVKAYIQRAHDFALPTDGATPIVMVGPGTGVAPFRAFLQEREATGAKGPAWLFFGHQRRHADFFYEDEMHDLLASGILSKLSLAWSRDTDRKVYVQDKMREEGEALWSWLRDGAHLYVCGDAKRMAVDVEATLVAVCEQHGGMDAARAKQFLKELRTAGRYQTDVY